jgi:L-malate glycosyltransferase
MRICFLAHAASIHTRHWTAFFRQQGHEVSVISLTPGVVDSGIDLHLLSLALPVSYEHTNWQYLVRLPQLWDVLRQLRPDIVNAHFLSSYGVLGALVRPARCAFVVSLHGSDILTIPRRSILHTRAAQFALRRADLITSVAQHTTAEIHRYVPAGLVPILTLQYGVDTSRFCPDEPPIVRRPIALSTRGMVSTSNLETVLLAARELDKIGSPIQFHFVNDGELLVLLQRQTAELQLANRVRFLGRVDHLQMANALRSASLYVSLSRSDGASLSLLEAMACSAFPVVADIPANQEWITDGVNGYLVPVDSPEALAAKLDRAWNQPDLRRAAAAHNWSLIRKKGDYHKNMAIIESAFTHLVEQAHDPS